MDLTVPTLSQGALLIAANVPTSYVADRSFASVPGLKFRITTNVLIGAVLGALLVKLLD